ncbi:hypothetical protein [Microbispora bryophytorum]|uniref:hypothetical protein n=1 Tax=Microbispora bryophytorum TaxID=1460882 RepID=UPI0033DFCBF9
MVILNPPFSIPPTWVDELRVALSQPDKAWSDSTHASLIATAKELDSWLRQARPYKGIQRQGWLSLLKDFEHSATTLGPETVKELGVVLTSAIATTQSLYTIFGTHRETVAASLFAARHTADQAALSALIQQLESTTVRRSALRDLMAACKDDASSHDIITWRRDLLWDLFRLAKYDLERLSHSFLGVIADRKFAVIDTQVWLGDKDASDFDAHLSLREKAGLSESQRLTLCERLTAAPAITAHHVVWFAYAHASIDRLDIGPLSFFDGEWVRLTLKEEGPFINQLPAELTDPDSWFTHESLPDVREVALVRVDLGTGTFTDPLQTAREQAEAAVTLAGFRQGDVTWNMLQGYLHAINGHIGGIGAFRPQHSIDMMRPADYDNMSKELGELKSELGPHIPLRDPMLLEIVDAVRDWQEATRQSALSAVLLNVRTLEFLSARMGCEKWYEYLEAYYAASWVRAQMHRGIHDAAYLALYSEVPGISEIDKVQITRLRQSIFRHHRGGYVADLRLVISALPTLTHIYTMREQFGRRLHTLAGRLSSPAAVAGWRDDLKEEWDRSRARLQRVRNALAHGNPIEPMSAYTVHLYSQRLAATALSVGINGVLDSTSSLLAEHDRHKNKAVAWFASVPTAATVEDALFI